MAAGCMACYQLDLLARVNGFTGDWQQNQTLRNEKSVAGTRVIIIYYESGNFHIIGPICTRKLFAKFIAK